MGALVEALLWGIGAIFGDLFGSFASSSALQKRKAVADSRRRHRRLMQSYLREIRKRPNARLVGVIDGGATGLIHDPASGHLLCFVHESPNRFARWTSETMRIDDARAARLMAEYRMQDTDPLAFKDPQ